MTTVTDATMYDYVTDRGEMPCYTCVRITWDGCPSAVRGIFEGMQYIISNLEVSKVGVKHYHIVTIGYMPGDVRGRYNRFVVKRPTDKWRKQDYRGKNLKGNLLTAISYTVKMGCWAAVGDEAKYWLGCAPAWVHNHTDTESTPEKDKLGEKHWMLTEKNLLPTMRKFVRENPEYSQKDFITVFAALVEKTPWFPGEYLRRGIDPCFMWKFDMPPEEAAISIVNECLTRGKRRYDCR